jgi:hypothetical protein
VVIPNKNHRRYSAHAEKRFEEPGVDHRFDDITNHEPTVYKTGFRFVPTTAAPCTSDPETFFLGTAESSKAAVEACSHCPFLVECRLEGLERSEYGVWGGLSHNARARMTAPERKAEMQKLRILLAQKQLTKRKAS